MKFEAPQGILRYLVANKRGEEIHVTTKCNETINDRPPRLIVTYPNNDHWASCQTFDFGQYIQVELEKNFYITGYSYERLPSTVAYMMNWEFQASRNGNVWTVLDKHEDDNIFYSNVEIHPRLRGGIYRFFRIYHTGLNHYDYMGDTHPYRTILYVRYLDLYGFLANITSHVKKKYNIHVFFIIFLILQS